ncbi:MAG: iron dicitrate transport regulator FecR [Cyanobacteriota bacterium]
MRRSPASLLLPVVLPVLLPAVLLPVVVGVPAPPPARSADSAVIREILDGDQLFVEGRKAKVSQQASAPEAVSTKASRGALSFPNGAVGRINRFSQMRLGQSCFLLDRGQVLVSGKAAGCTRSARLSVRGTNYLLVVDEQGESQLSVLEGSVEVDVLRDGEPSGTAPTTVQAGQRLRLSAQGVVLALLSLTSGDYDAILRGPLFNGFRLPLPQYGSLESYLRRYQPSVTLPALPGVQGVQGVPGVSLPSIGLPRLF